MRNTFFKNLDSALRNSTDMGLDELEEYLEFPPVVAACAGAIVKARDRRLGVITVAPGSGGSVAAFIDDIRNAVKEELQLPLSVDGDVNDTNFPVHDSELPAMLTLYQQEGSIDAIKRSMARENLTHASVREFLVFLAEHPGAWQRQSVALLEPTMHGLDGVPMCLVAFCKVSGECVISPRLYSEMDSARQWHYVTKQVN